MRTIILLAFFVASASAQIPKTSSAIGGGGGGGAPSGAAGGCLAGTYPNPGLSPCLYVAGGGTAQAQTATYSPAITLTTGQQACWLPLAANTSAAPTFAPNGLTAHTIVKQTGAALVANDIITTAVACAVYDTTGTQWELQNPQAITGTGVAVFGTSPTLTNSPALNSGFPNATFQQTQDNPLTIGANIITVTSTTGWPSTGLVLIIDTTNSEAVSYSGITSTTLTGVVRGLYGTSAHAHALGRNLIPIEFISAPSTSNVPDFVILRWGAAANNTTVALAGLTDSCVTGNSGSGVNLVCNGSSGMTGGTFLLNGGVFSSIAGQDTYLRTAAGRAINIGDNQAQTVTINGSTGLTVIGGASLSSPKYLTATDCTSVASPAVCGSAAAGTAVLAAAATTIVVNTTAVTANSEIHVTEDSSLGAKLSVTCNTQSSLVVGTLRATARSAGTSFTVAIDVAPTTNPICFSYSIRN